MSGTRSGSPRRGSLQARGLIAFLLSLAFVFSLAGPAFTQSATTDSAADVAATDTVTTTDTSADGKIGRAHV